MVVLEGVRASGFVAVPGQLRMLLRQGARVLSSRVAGSVVFVAGQGRELSGDVSFRGPCSAGPAMPLRRLCWGVEVMVECLCFLLTKIHSGHQAAVVTGRETTGVVCSVEDCLPSSQYLHLWSFRNAGRRDDCRPHSVHSFPAELGSASTALVLASPEHSGVQYRRFLLPLAIVVSFLSLLLQGFYSEKNNEDEGA